MYAINFIAPGSRVRFLLSRCYFFDYQFSGYKYKCSVLLEKLDVIQKVILNTIFCLLNVAREIMHTSPTVRYIIYYIMHFCSFS